ncbi:class I SAM-dependent methyltransferase [Saccharothrix syringae]|uniref:Methyltransferase type 11 domain-containing protein n=1 Tax=Saccharothrix syringae TaxID=103733 RepID=A0A5Q0H9G4_SACSY|nr:methyltransferase domain-containing protein [Saccharothrix syringae]QFZ22878.1 hypothetical protein EKG83_40510 [Saccharothrix syringae]
MAHRELHRDRTRAESFGSVARRYDRYRPGYPAALVDDLVAVGPTRVLDVGCGTGKVAAALVGRGLPVLGVEVDGRMAEVAGVWRPRPRPLPDPVAGSAAFSPAVRRVYRWERTLTADEWTGLASTVSDHLRLGPERLAGLLRELRVVVGSLGGGVRARCETTALLARRTDR